MMKTLLGRIACAFTIFLLPAAVLANPPAGLPVMIGLDEAYSQPTNTAPKAIERGVLAAIEEINARGGVLGGRPLKLITTDNQGVAARARDNYAHMAMQADVVAVLGGKFSPFLVETLPEAQRLRVPLISVWGSADPITEGGFQPSFAFRLSLKDSWGAEALLRRAKTSHKAERVCAVLPNTAWGRSNDAVFSAKASAVGTRVVATRWYNWGEQTFTEILQGCRSAGAQALILVANEKEASVLFKQMADQPPADRLPVVSHWGLTGGAIVELAGPALEKIDLQVIQTFTFIGNERPAAKRLARWLMKEGGFNRLEDIPSPVGSAHAYDMTHLIAMAVNKAGSTRGDAVRDALENLPAFDGAVRRYAPAFTPTRHDALSPAQVLFVRIDRTGALAPLR